ncbi:MAG: response regulator receiver domain [Candidatus Thiodiazotropha endolucinida]
MTDGDAVMALEYGDLIEEAFIDPIRTVVVVDDDFPTLDSLLDRETGGVSRKSNTTHLEQARNIVKLCRERSRPWLVDIYDGQGDLISDEQAATHLHHSDLLILDYHLDPKNQSDGSRAINLLRRLADNDHFNLVVVYTQGDESIGGHISRAVNDIALGLCTFDDRLDVSGPALERAKDVIAEWEDEDELIQYKLKSSIDESAYLQLRNNFEDLNFSNIYHWPEFAEIKALIDNGPKKNEWRLVLKWAIHKRQQLLMEKLAEQNYGQLNYHPNDNEINWIRTSRLFITVVSKTNEPSDIPDKLLHAIKTWDPQPHRLLMSKMRSVLDECGVSAEDEVMQNRCLQAGWLEDLLAVDKDERLWKVNRTLNRHWDRLGDSIMNRMGEYSRRLADHLSSTSDKDQVLKRFSPLKDNHHKQGDDVAMALNSYSCSKPVDGTHLTTGHILKMVDDRYWLCLTPACDLVPGQKKGWHERLNTHMPFTAVELHNCNRDKALRHATNGSYLFLEVDNNPLILSFIPDSSGESTPNPKIEHMFAANSGIFDNSSFDISLTRIRADGVALVTPTFKASVVAQLRYEYALNLLQRLGSTQSRVGLDFVSHSPPS